MQQGDVFGTGLREGFEGTAVFLQTRIPIQTVDLGAEALRQQRGRNEVKVMVRYPQDERRSLGDFENMRVRLPDGSGIHQTVELLQAIETTIRRRRAAPGPRPSRTPSA